jgi:hypothetical protein
MSDAFAMLPLVGIRGRGQSVLVSDVDVPRVESHRWFLNKGGYACANVRPDGREGTVKLHVHLFGTRRGLELDHINRDRLDNRRSNLRWVSHAENMQNTMMRRTNRCGAHGVRWHAKSRLYQARIQRFGKTIYLGYYTELDAAARVVQQWLKMNALQRPTLAEALDPSLKEQARCDPDDGRIITPDQTPF